MMDWMRALDVAAVARRSAATRCAVAAVMVGVMMAGSPPLSAAQGEGAVSGTVVDPLGMRLPATVSLLQDEEAVSEQDTDANGAFRFDGLAAGRYRVEGRALGFAVAVSPTVFVGATSEVRVDLSLQIGPIEQHVVVTAAAVDLPQSQSGSPVTVIDRDLLEQFGKADVLEVLRLVPGASVVQTGARGSTTSIFLRGGGGDFNKVLIDGVPANDIGGAFDFGAFAMAGVEQLEVLRSANSVIYGPDALSGVISLTTRRGDTRRPELTYAIDGGNLATVRNELSVGGVAGRFDYFLDVSRFDTDNDLANNEYRNDSVAGRFGVRLARATDLNATVRHTKADLGLPGAVLFNGITNDSSQSNDLMFLSVNARSQVTNRLQTNVQLSSMDSGYRFVDPAPTGKPFDPFGFGAHFLGDEVTVVGANGYQATGRAILDFGGVYPLVYEANSARRMVSGQADYYVNEAFDVSAGVRLNREEGVAGTSATTERTNVGSFVEARWAVGYRLHLTGGVGFEHNDLFGYATTPRLSVAFYARPPSPTATGALSDTKLTFNVGRGIKAPGVLDEQSSLFALLPGVPGGIDPGDRIGPERSRNIDVGIEQALWGRRARVRVAYFHNEFDDLIEFVSKFALPQLGVPTEVAAGVPFGATVNASSYRAQGIETSIDLSVGDVRVAASYTYVDAIVTESFSGSALFPSINPAFPDIEIGQFSPLVGARPFRRPAHSGSLFASYLRGPAQVTLTGYFVGKSDDSTFLSDAFFGPSLLLPNRDLIAGYQKADLSGSYRVHRRLRWYASIENLLDQGYTAAAGFPALPLTFRSGLSVTLGGD